MSIADALTVDRWLFATLTGDTALQVLVDERWYVDIAPQTAVYPLGILIPPPQDQTVRPAGPGIVMHIGRWAVKAVGPDTFEALEPIVKRVHELLHGASGVVSSGTVIGAVVDGRIRYTETVEGQIYRHLGLLVTVYSQ